jgi:tetratricopeptide (TPR) repeat protein
MDCRKPLVLVMGLLVGVGGCTYSLSELRVSAGLGKKDKEEVVLKPSTYVAFAEFREKAALTKEVSDAQRQQLREEARLSYLKALEADAKYLPAYTGLARLQQTTGDHAGAVETYHKALDIEPRDAGLWFELGMCHCRQKDWPGALENLGKAVELDPANRQYLTVCGYTLARAGKWEEALAMLTRVNGEARAHYDLARMLRHTNQPAKARAHAQAALTWDPNFREAQALLDELDGKAPRPQPVLQTNASTKGRPDSGAGTGATGPAPKIITPAPATPAKAGEKQAESTGQPLRLPPLPVPVSS